MQPDPRYPQAQYWAPPPLAPPPPRPAGIGRRLLGWFVDYLIVMVPGMIVVGLGTWSLVRGLPAYVGGVAADVGVSRLFSLVTHRGGGSGGVGAVASGAWLGLALPLIGALLAVPMLQFLYQASLLAWRGRTVGKIVADTRVGPAVVGVPPRFALKRALATTFTETGLVGFGLALAVYGEFTFGVLVLFAATVVWWVNLLLALGSRHRTVVDRVAGTSVLRGELYAQVAARSAELARRSSAAAITTGRRTTDAAVVAGRMGADAAAVAAQMAAEATAAARRRSAEQFPAAARRTTDAAAAAARVTAAAAVDAAAVAGQVARQGGQAARQGAEKLIQTAPVQRALDSKAGQQARELGDRTAGAARQVGDRTQQLWRQRRAARAEPPDAPPEPGSPD
jgi:uncharacterized RDD family membrane protein YckC